MSVPAGWRRVGRGVRCPVCGRPDWCLLSVDGTRAVCPRVESPRRFGQAGYIHTLTDSPAPSANFARVEDTGPATDFTAVSEHFAAQAGDVTGLARTLGVPADALVRLGVGFASAEDLARIGTRCRASGARTFPMRDARGRVVGIHVRAPDGGKFTVRGSRLGLFIPTGINPSETLLIPEGLTDTAAIVGLEFAAIGRPSAASGAREVVGFVRRYRPRRVVVVADADEAGQRGAGCLAAVLRAYVREVSTITPPSPLKDARSWIVAGASRAEVQRAIDEAPARRLRVRGAMRTRA